MSRILKKIIFLTTSAIVFVPVFVAQAQYGIDVTIKATPLSKFKDATLQTMTGNLLGAVLSLVGVAFFALMVFGGITWMSAAGNQEREKKAIGIIVSAGIGIILVLSAYILVNWVFGAFKTG